jgi:5-methylcytosine-specific restriction endonuclease McrA
VSKKRAKILSEFNKVTKEKAKEITCCEGCGSNKPLERSHIISRARNFKLTDDVNNIRFLCRECHQKWESRNIVLMKELNCFEKDLEYIKTQDEVWYQKLISK